MFEILLWGSIVMLAYIYVGYPLLVIILVRLFKHPVSRGAELPSITVIITANNEERHIAEKIGDVLALDYPDHSVEITVVSDASDDATDEIVSSHSVSGVRLLRIEGRLGKTGCQNAAAAASDGELLVFTDATTMLDSQALRFMAQNSTTQPSDAWLGVSGCLYAVRRSAYVPIAPDMTSDFVIAMDMREQQLRTILEPAAVCTETTLDRPERELAMRIRVGLQSLSALASRRRFLNPFRYGVFAWQLWSHKLLRYLSPVLVLLALASNLALAAGPVPVADGAATRSRGGGTDRLHSRLPIQTFTTDGTAVLPPPDQRGLCHWHRQVPAR